MRISLFRRRRCLRVIALLTAAALLLIMTYIHVVLLFTENYVSLEPSADRALLDHAVHLGKTQAPAPAPATSLASVRSSLPTFGSNTLKPSVPSVNNHTSMFSTERMARFPQKNTSTPLDKTTKKYLVGEDANHSPVLKGGIKQQSSIETSSGHHHHRAVPDTLPGAFANNSIYVQTIRFTTSYQPSIQDLHVDLFGFSGDATRYDGWKPFCSDVPQNFNQTLLGRRGLRDNTTLFCQPDFDNSGTNKNVTSQKLFQMFLLPISTVDYGQTLGTVIWRCNVTDLMNKQQLIQHIDDGLMAGNAAPTATVHLWIRYSHRRSVTRLATFQIPLDAGSLGVGSVHIRGSSVAKSYFHRAPVAAGLCVAIFGTKPLIYLSQFVQHHLNVGFGSIVIGVKGAADSDELNQTQKLLQRYIDRGVVVLAHYDSPFTCNRIYGRQVDQMQFYQPCLYHHKGLTKYSATWDVDEYWAPPDFLHMDGRHNHEYFQVGLDSIVRPENVTRKEPSGIINASAWSTYPDTIVNDPLWKDSPYAHSVSIADTFRAIDRYYVEHGCATSFCFHLFPSRVVWARDGVTDENRSFMIGKDFEMRKVYYDNAWQKSVVNTKYAHMSGIHVPGSCFFEDSLDANLSNSLIEKKFHQFAHTAACNPRRFEHEVYGSIHHFFNLLFTRWPPGEWPNDNVTMLDEYVSLYSKTVEGQLKRDGDLIYESSLL